MPLIENLNSPFLIHEFYFLHKVLPGHLIIKLINLTDKPFPLNYQRNYARLNSFAIQRIHINYETIANVTFECPLDANILPEKQFQKRSFGDIPLCGSWR